jgi:hypothetical protein
MTFDDATLQMTRFMVGQNNGGNFPTREWLNFLKDKETSYLDMINFHDNFSSIDGLVASIKSVYQQINGNDYSNLVIRFVVGTEGVSPVFILFTRELTQGEKDIIEGTLSVTLENKDTNIAMLIA